MSVPNATSPHFVGVMDQGGVMWPPSITSLVQLHSESRWLVAYDVALVLLLMLVAYPYFSHYLGKDAGRLKAEMAQVGRDLQAAQVRLPGTRMAAQLVLREFDVCSTLSSTPPAMASWSNVSSC